MLKFRALCASALVMTTFSFVLPSAQAQNTAAGDCFTQWKGADANRNGVLDKGEAGASADQEITRDEFLADCTKGAKLVEPPGKPSEQGLQDDFPKDLGKGDLTKGNNKFSREEAYKRLESLGYKDIQDLELDANGIWRGTAFAQGERQTVGLDAQGDVVSQ